MWFRVSIVHVKDSLLSIVLRWCILCYNFVKKIIKENNFKLTNCCYNNNAVKKCPWKCPLYFIFAFNPIPAIFLHCFQNAVLKFLVRKIWIKWNKKKSESELCSGCEWFSQDLSAFCVLSNNIKAILVIIIITLLLLYMLCADLWASLGCQHNYKLL